MKNLKNYLNHLNSQIQLNYLEFLIKIECITNKQ